MKSEGVAIRAVLTKKGEPDVRVELRRGSPSDFEVIENGRPIGVFYRTMTPPNKRRPGAPDFGAPLGLHEAWEKCIAQRYRGYEVTNLEEGHN